MKRIQRRLTDSEAEFLGFQIRVKKSAEKRAPRYELDPDQLERLERLRSGTESKTQTSANDYRATGPAIIMSAWSPSGKMMGIDEYCTHYNLPREDITSYKLVSHTGTPYFNIVFKERVDAVPEKIDFEAIFSRYAQPEPVKTAAVKWGGSGHFDRVVITDVHIGMNPNEEGLSLYGGKWDAEEINARLALTVDHILKNRNADTLIVDDLGDFMDGYDGETVRKGHELPQNMSNEEAFDCGLGFKIRLIDSLAGYYDRIICHNICDDNHAGSFGYVVNSAFKTFIEARYSHVTAVNVRTFMYHYTIGKKCFIVTHGKDGKNLKFGFKPILESKQIEKINDYIKENELAQPGVEIFFDKGDSHQFILDYTTADGFNYFNYPAFSPASNWIQTNFKKGKSGFVMFNFDKEGGHTIRPLFFKWDRNREVANELINV